MRLFLILMGAGLLAGCTKETGPQHLDFISTARYTSSNRTGLAAADTLATRFYAETTDGSQLGRMRITVRYMPKRDPFLYPVPLSLLNRDLIDNNPEDFVFLDSTLTRPNGTHPDSLLMTLTYGVRTTAGSERWQYSLYNTTDSNPTASRAVLLSMRRADSLTTYQDYTLKLVIPAVGVPAGPNNSIRNKSTRRFLQLKSGLALPAYTVLRAGAPDPDVQAVAQQLTDLIILPDGLTLVAPDAAGLNAARWPTTNRRATRIYLVAGQTATTFATQIADATITNLYNIAASSTTATGQTTGSVQAGQVYAFKTDEATPRYGLLLVVSIPSSTTTTTTAGLQLQVRMAKI